MFQHLNTSIMVEDSMAAVLITTAEGPTTEAPIIMADQIMGVLITMEAQIMVATTTMAIIITTVKLDDFTNRANRV